MIIHHCETSCHISSAFLSFSSSMCSSLSASEFSWISSTLSSSLSPLQPRHLLYFKLRYAQCCRRDSRTSSLLACASVRKLLVVIPKRHAQPIGMQKCMGTSATRCLEEWPVPITSWMTCGRLPCPSSQSLLSQGGEIEISLKMALKCWILKQSISIKNEVNLWYLIIGEPAFPKERWGAPNMVDQGEQTWEAQWTWHYGMGDKGFSCTRREDEHLA